MRASHPVLLAAALLLASPALHATTKHKTTKHAVASLAAPACVYDADKTAFDIEGLKSQLMVTAENCGADAKDKYNAFMSRYHPEVASAELDLQGYFKRSYGKAGSKQYDEYMTQLADNQALIGLKAGTAYCQNLNVMYDEVMSLHDGTELHDYSNAKMLYQPTDFETCTAAAPAVATKSHVRHSKTKHT